MRKAVSFDNCREEPLIVHETFRSCLWGGGWREQCQDGFRVSHTLVRSNFLLDTRSSFYFLENNNFIKFLHTVAK